MNLSNLDTWFSENRIRCCILFSVFAFISILWVFGMIECSRTVVHYADPYSYILLFEENSLNHFILGRLVFNTMEYLYAGKGLLWIFLKSLSVVDVLWLMCGILILFQDSQNRFASRMRTCTVILLISMVLIVALYSMLLSFASIQLTTEAGFTILRMAGLYGQLAGMGILLASFVMTAVMILIKK